ncbi:MAG: glycerol-3-phosphate dehydrogenase/oxidase [Thalassotalea sp.]|nr:glycerol-3-phosphate dehydrogenase/oxidase [Thalassotalea sp.]
MMASFSDTSRSNSLSHSDELTTNRSSSVILSGHFVQSREQRIAQLKATKNWDLIIIGGGITGAGILKLASQMKLKVLLVEQKDFAWGSSSRSSKMIHGGLRYMAQGQFRLTKESVTERERLLSEGYPLITKQSFVMSHYRKVFPSPWLFGQLLNCYDFIAGMKQHKYWPKAYYEGLVPSVDTENLLGGTQFTDALTDDARLVLRLIQESLQLGGQALNYAKVSKVAQLNNVAIDDRNDGYKVSIELDEEELQVNSKVVVNACGAWSNQLLTDLGSTPSKRPKYYMRPLRGSHLIIPSWCLPLGSVVSVRHQLDNRPVQIYPWLNVTVVGTTDEEHKDDLNREAKISQQEFDYLLDAVAQQFPNAGITEKDIISTWAGVRPVITNEKQASPSKEKRDHHIEQQGGLISVTGGKLTTFRLIAEQTMALACKRLSGSVDSSLVDSNSGGTGLANINKRYDRAIKAPIFSKYKGESLNHFRNEILNQTLSCYGELSENFIAISSAEDLLPIRYTRHLWAELAWAAKYEHVHHLDDLLLRRTRLGNLLPSGGDDILPRVERLCREELGWSEAKWQAEVERYRELWRASYSLPTEKSNNK